MPKARYFGHGGDDAMHIADSIVIGFLIACMLLVAAKVLHKAQLGAARCSESSMQTLMHD